VFFDKQEINGARPSTGFLSHLLSLLQGRLVGAPREFGGRR
jgi:hypothetical protein